MVRSGLSSVSYRNQAPEAIIAAAAAAGLRGIEWTADTHVPHGNIACAERVMMATLRAGLTVSAYGSFFRLGSGSPAVFSSILETSRRLQAPAIRIWGGPTAGASQDSMLADAADAADAAGKHGITLCLEPNERSALPDYDTLAGLIERADHPFLKACWTQLPSSSASGLGEGAERIGPHLALAHIRNWSPFSSESEESAGSACVRALAFMIESNRASVLDRWALIEYLENDAPETLKKKAETLEERLKAAEGT